MTSKTWNPRSEAPGQSARPDRTSVAVALMAAVVLSLVLNLTVYAANPPPVQTYYVPFTEEQVRTSLVTLYSGTGDDIRTVISIAPAGTRGEALAGLFLVGYIGMAVPVMLLGLALQFIALIPAVIGFGAIMIALLIVTAITLARTSLDRVVRV